jgi:hypothetical protein
MSIYIPEGWNRERIAGTNNWRTTVPLSDVRLTATGKLLFRPGCVFYPFKPGHIIEINNVEVAVVKMEKAEGFPPRTFLVTIEGGDQIEDFEQLFRVAQDNLFQDYPFDDDEANDINDLYAL